MSFRRMGLTVVALAAAGALAAGPIHAQGMTTELGVKGGVNFADFGGDDATGVESRTRFVGGAYAGFGLSDLITIQPEVLFSMKGAESNDPSDPGEVKLDYIEIPVLFRVNVPVPNSPVRPHVFVGPAVSFETGCTLVVGGLEEDCESGSTKTTDFGAVFGGGVDFLVGGARVGLDVRYNLGLRSLDNSTSPDDVKNRVLSIMGSIGLGLNR